MPKGNPGIAEAGKRTRFKKGQPSPNPGGRPKYKLISEAHRAVLEHDDLKSFVPQSNAEAIALSIAREAIEGKNKVNAASEITDRLEGKPRQSYEVKMSITDELADRIEKARKRVIEKNKK